MVSSNTPELSNGGAPAAATRSLKDVVIRLAGNSQDGIQTIGGFLARLAGRTRPGRHDLHDDPVDHLRRAVHLPGADGHGDILSAGDQADFLVAFYQHSYESHIDSLRPGGVLIYDSDHVKPNPEDRRFTAIGMPITAATVEAVGGSAKEKGKNIFVLGLLARIFNLDVAKLTGLVAERFGGKSEDIVRNAMLAFDAGYA